MRSSPDFEYSQLERDWEHLADVLARSKILSVSEEVHSWKTEIYSTCMETPIRFGQVYICVEIVEPSGLLNELTFTPAEWREIKP